MDLLNLAVKSIFIENILLATFLGMCSFLAISKRMEAATGLGMAVIFVQFITVPANWLIKHFLLEPGALAWTGIPALASQDLSFLSFICFIAVIASLVQLVEMIMDRFFPPLYQTLGIFLPLITVNCAILGASLFMVIREYTFITSLLFGLGSGIGWLLAIVAMSGIRTKLRTANIPPALEGPGISLIIAGFMAMAFMGFSGMIAVS